VQVDDSILVNYDDSGLLADDRYPCIKEQRARRASVADVSKWRQGGW
jgi:hypothetical protein